jgi:hypothetical protein
MEYLNGGEPEQCVSVVRRVFMKNASQSMCNTADSAVVTKNKYKLKILS